MMISRSWGNVKGKKATLEYSQVLAVARKLLVDKMTPRAIAKELRLDPRTVTNLRAAKTNKELWIEAIAELAKEGLLK